MHKNFCLKRISDGKGIGQVRKAPFRVSSFKEVFMIPRDFSMRTGHFIFMRSLACVSFFASIAKPERLWPLLLPSVFDLKREMSFKAKANTTTNIKVTNGKMRENNCDVSMAGFGIKTNDFN